VPAAARRFWNFRTPGGNRGPGFRRLMGRTGNNGIVGNVEASVVCPTLSAAAERDEPVSAL